MELLAYDCSEIRLGEGAVWLVDGVDAVGSILG